MIREEIVAIVQKHAELGEEPFKRIYKKFKSLPKETQDYVGSIWELERLFDEKDVIKYFKNN